MIINNKQLIELFGSDVHKEHYKKYRKVHANIKNSILNDLRQEYSIVNDLGKGKYEIDNKFNGTCNIPNSKIKHDIFGNLIPSILLSVKNSHDNSKVFCLSLTGIYGMYNMIHKNNYNSIKSRKNTASKILDLDLDNTSEYLDGVHSSLKYYLSYTLNLLETLNLIKVNDIPYVKEYKIFSSIDKKSSKELKENIYRRATKEEEQTQKDICKKLDIKHNIKEDKERWYGKKSRKYINEYNKEIQSIGIEYFYECYEVICLDKKSIINILEFYDLNDTNRLILSENFKINFTNLIMNTAKTRISKRCEIEEVVNKYISDFEKLTMCTLDSSCENIYIPHHTVKFEEDKFGNYSNNITKND